eukprot:CCRYP_019087-RA/>CCRYP_019087-RA protein AED:0.36 eAED:0.49 QI:0/0.75/0.6/1/0.75/0.6/5/129/370
MLVALLRVMVGASSRSGNSLAENVALIVVASSVAGAAKDRVAMGLSVRFGGWSKVRRAADRAADIMVLAVGGVIGCSLLEPSPPAFSSSFRPATQAPRTLVGCLTKGAKYTNTLEPNAVDVKRAKSVKLSREMSMAFEQGIGAKSLKHLTDSRMSMEFVGDQQAAAPFVLLRTKTQKNVFASDGAEGVTVAPSVFSLEYIPMGSKSSKVGSPKIEKGQESSAPKTVQAPKKEKMAVASDASASETLDFSLNYVQVASKSSEFEPSYGSKTHKIDATIETTKQNSSSKTTTSTKRAPSTPTVSPVVSKYSATKSSKDSIPIPMTRSITFPEDMDAQVSQANKSEASSVAIMKWKAHIAASLVLVVGAMIVV